MTNKIIFPPPSIPLLLVAILSWNENPPVPSVFASAVKHSGILNGSLVLVTGVSRMFRNTYTVQLSPNFRDYLIPRENLNFLGPL